MTVSALPQLMYWRTAFISSAFLVLYHPAAMSMTNDIVFTSSRDGSAQRYVQVLPEGFDATRHHDVLVALHGHGSDRWQFVNDPRDECRAARDVAAEHGMIYISPDYRARTSWMGPAAEVDLVDIITALREAHRIRRVFVCGGSMGAASALTFAALHPELVAGIAAMNGIANHLEYANFQDAIGASFGGSKGDIPDEYRKRSAEFHAEAFTMPVALTTGGRDTSTPPDSVLRLADALRRTNPNVLLIHRENEGHRTSYADGRAIIEFTIDKAAGTREAAP